MERVENLVARGTPDVEGCYDGFHFHIELKQCTKPKLNSTNLNIRLEKSQIVWLKKRIYCMDNVFILLRVSKEYFLFDLTYEGEYKIDTLKDGIRYDDLLYLAIQVQTPEDIFNYFMVKNQF